MILNARPLTPEYAPRDLHHRDGELDALTAALAPLTSGSGGEPVLMDGPPGVGKTTLARFVARQLESEAFDVRWGYVDCLTRSAPGALLNQLCHDAGVAASLTLAATAVGEYYDALAAADGQVVVICDEVAFADDKDVLAGLYETAGVTPIYITTDGESLLADVVGRSADRLRHAEAVHLRPYTHSALVDILRARANVALAPGSLGNGVIEECADIAAGNARHAIALLRKAVRATASDGQAHVERADVAAVADAALEDIHQRRIGNLGNHQRVLFEIIREAGTIEAGKLHDRYEDRVGTPKSKRTRRDYLSGLESYSLIVAEGSTSDRKYRYVGPSPVARASP